MTSLDDQIIGEIRSLSLELSRQSGHALYGPAKFWESLSAKHTYLLGEYGFKKFKRTVNFEYNQWGVHSFQDVKIRHLLKQLFLNGEIPWGMFCAKATMAAATDIRWPDSIDPGTGQTLSKSRTRKFLAPSHLSAYTIYLGLLWQFALQKDRLGCLSHCEEPTIGDPLPITYRNELISQDLALSSLELNLIAKYVNMKRVVRVAEIGAGYGRLAYLVEKMFPKVEYFIFDIPPALVIAKHYLGQIFGSGRVLDKTEQGVGFESFPGSITVSLPHRLADVPDSYFDLIINISSFDEMSIDQVKNYFSLIEAKCKGALYVKGYAQTRSPGVRLGVHEFPYPKHWSLLCDQKDPATPLFMERIYKVR